MALRLNSVEKRMSYLLLLLNCLGMTNLKPIQTTPSNILPSLFAPPKITQAVTGRLILFLLASFPLSVSI